MDAVSKSQLILFFLFVVCFEVNSRQLFYLVSFFTFILFVCAMFFARGRDIISLCVLLANRMWGTFYVKGPKKHALERTEKACIGKNRKSHGRQRTEEFVWEGMVSKRGTSSFPRDSKM